MTEAALFKELLMSLGVTVVGYVWWRWVKDTHYYWTNTYLQGVFPLPGAPTYAVLMVVIGGAFTAKYLYLLGPAMLLRAQALWMPVHESLVSESGPIFWTLFILSIVIALATFWPKKKGR